MKRPFYFLIAIFLATVFTAVQAHPTMSGRLVSYDGSKGLLTLELESGQNRVFQLDNKTEITWHGRKVSASVLPANARVSVQVLGALNRSPLKAGKIVDWGSSEQIVATTAKAPYYTPVAAYATTAGGGGTPDGAPVGNHSPQHALAAVAHGGSQNKLTPGNHTPGMNSPAPGMNSHPSMGQTEPTFYRNQGDAMMGPLEMMQIDPYSSSSAPPSSPTQFGMPGMDSNMMSMPTLHHDMTTGSGSSLMGLDSDEDESGSMMFLGGESHSAAGQKLTGRILQSSLEQGFFILQPFELPEMQRVLVQPGASHSMDLLVPGQMVEVTGERTPHGFKASSIQPAPGF